MTEKLVVRINFFTNTVNLTNLDTSGYFVLIDVGDYISEIEVNIYNGNSVCANTINLLK